MNLASISIPTAAEELQNKLGDLSGISLIGNHVLVAIYKRPEKTKGGIYLTDNALQEDIYQGKIGLIIKTGEKAFDREWCKIYGDSVVPKVGDWVVTKVYDTWQQEVNGVPTRQFKDSDVRAVIKSPDMVY